LPVRASRPVTAGLAGRAAAAFAVGLALIAGACGGSGRPAARVELRVSAAVSLTESLQSVAATFEAQTGTRVLLNLAGSNTLAAQILEGAPVDVFISADAAQMDRVEAAHALAPGTRVDLLSNSLVVITPADGGASIGGARDLLAPGIEHLALGDPAAVPAGVYARQWLERAGVWAELQPKIVPLPHVRAVVTAVSSGSAEAGIVYRTDAAVGKGIRVAWDVPASDAPVIVYPAAVISTTTNPDHARAFVAFLRTPGASALFAGAGFGPPPGKPAAR
jgi:molybdate transport system substrate-binding protein